MKVKIMKIFGKTIVLLVLTAFLCAFFGTGTVLAKTDVIPDTFNVNEYLKLKDNQKSLVPSAQPAGAANADEVAATTGVTGVLVKTIGLLVKIIASLSLIIFIVGALLAITSEGKEDRLEKGKTAMVYSLIGLVVALLSFVIVAFVQSIFY